ncbi:hypothetical protein M8J77_018572 [Diaphorina citri]|nr:hypothetical protein M8J77_018572 [Diaphorina citri]
MEGDRIDRIASMMSEFQESLRLAMSSTQQTPDIVSSLQLLDAAFREFQAAVIEELGQLKVAVERIDSLEERQTRLEERQEAQEQYSRRNSLLLRGVPENRSGRDTEDDCLHHVMDLIQNKLGLDLGEEVISRCHRLNSKDKTGKNARPIIMKFYSYKHRRMVFGQKKKLKGLPISISEFLTPERLAVFRQAKAVHGMKNCWTSDGKIIIKLNIDGVDKRMVIRHAREIPPPPPVRNQEQQDQSSKSKVPKSRTPVPATVPVTTRRAKATIKK